MRRRRENQTVLAAVLGVTQPGISERLAGKRAWRTADLEALAKHYGVTVADLVADDESGEDA